MAAIVATPHFKATWKGIECIKMRNCVKSYIQRVGQGYALLYHIENEKEQATLGLEKGGSDLWVVEQLKGVKNCAVSSELNALAKTFVIQINNSQTRRRRE